MKRIDKNRAIFSMDKNNKAVDIIESGEVLIFETSDCYNGQLESEDMFLQHTNFEFTNPATGPVFVKDAEVGDALKISILDISVNQYGIMSVAPKYGVPGDKIESNRTKIINIENNLAKFDDEIEIKIEPMIGVIGTAPLNDPIGNVIPDYHGGNMDCKKIVKDSIVILPVNVKGGLLAIGDLHAVMADGEVCGCGLEIAGEVKVKIEIIKNTELPLPMIIDKSSVMCLSSKKTLDEAAIEATNNMHFLIIKYLNKTPAEASMLLSLVGNLGICQIVDPLKTARMEFPRKFIDIENLF